MLFRSLALVEASGSDAGGHEGPGFIEVNDPSNPQAPRVRISDLNDVYIGGNAVTAKISRQRYKPGSGTAESEWKPASEPDKNIAVRVNRDREEKKLADLLTAASRTMSSRLGTPY